MLLASVLVAAACGRTEADRLAPGNAGSSGLGGSGGTHAPAGEPGGTKSAPDDSTKGGAASQPVAGASGAGGAPSEGSIVGRVENRYTGEPVKGVLVVVDGVSFVSDEQGIVRAPSPMGPYDAIVFDGVGEERDVSVYEQLTLERPVFYVGREEQGAPYWQSTVQTSLSGPPPGSGMISFASENLYFDSVSRLDDPLFLAPAWHGAQSLNGIFHGVARIVENDVLTSVWYGSAAGTIVGGEPDARADIVATELPVRTFTVTVDEAGAKDVFGYIYFGPHWLGYAVGPPGVRTRVVPDTRPLAGAAEPLQLVMDCYWSDGWNDPRVRLSPILPSDVDELQVVCSPAPALLSPPADAVLGVDATFSFEAPSAPCRRVSITLPGLRLTIFTTRSQVRIPDLNPGQLTWPSSVAGSWQVVANGPCAGTDFYVSPATGRPSDPPRVLDTYRYAGRSAVEGYSPNQAFTTAAR